MAMFIVCTNCQSRNRVPDSAVGKKGKCPKCGVILTIPAADDSAGATEAEPAPVAAAPSTDIETQPSPSPPAAATSPLEGPEGTAAQEPSEQITVAASPSQASDADTPPAGASTPPSAVTAAHSFLAPAQAPGEMGRLGPYRVLQVLGHGGMGIVFIAEDPRLGRQVALKAMLPEAANKPSARERFLREARTAAAIEHDHIVAIYQVDEDRGVPYIAMPLLKGCSLEDWLQQRPHQALPVPLIIKLGREIASGLAAAHHHGLIHRDIKPANIFLQSVVRSSPSGGKESVSAAALVLAPDDGLRDCRVKILDFGLARLTAGEQHLTLSGVIMGTPAYMAPEQARSGTPVDARADLFSLGVVLYRLCTGTLPFRGDDMMSTLMSLAMDQPGSPRLLNPDLPQALSDLVMRLLEKEPKQRIGSADEVVQALTAMETAPTPRGESANAASTDVSEEPIVEVPPVREVPDDEEEERRPRRHRKSRYDDEDEWDPREIVKTEKGFGMSQASLIIGIVSASVGVFTMCCCSYMMPLTGIGGATAIVLGYLGLKQGDDRTKAQAGIALGAAAVLLAFGALLMLALGIGLNLVGQGFKVFPR
jgi:serine/threonine protein kinase